MFCPNCKNQMNDTGIEYACPYCGTHLRKDFGNNQNNAQQNYQQQRPRQIEEQNTAGYAVLGFFFPMIGFILWLVWKDDYPKRAKSAGQGALLSLIIGAVATVIILVIAFVLVGVATKSPGGSGVNVSAFFQI